MGRGRKGKRESPAPHFDEPRPCERDCVSVLSFCSASDGGCLKLFDQTREFKGQFHSIGGVKFAIFFLFFFLVFCILSPIPSRIMFWFSSRWHCNSLIQQSVYLMVCGLLTALY